MMSSVADQLGGRDDGAGAGNEHAQEGDQRDAQGRPPMEAVSKRNIAWSQAEHLLYLLGLDSHGRGAWRAIASNYCISRTPTQVASHAQKYFRRQELTSWQRHKKRPSIHDITCGSIHPSATAADRNAVRIALQNIVRECRDTNLSSDSATTDVGAVSRNKAALSNYLPTQAMPTRDTNTSAVHADPSFAQVFAFTNDTGSMSASGSNNEGTTGFTASPHPLQYPPVPPVPMMQLPAGYPHTNNWAALPMAGGMVPPEPTHRAEGVYLQPVVYATDQVHQRQDQLPYILSGREAGWLPPQHMLLAAGPEGHGSYIGQFPPSQAFADEPQHVPPAAQAASSSAPAAVAMFTGQQQQGAASEPVGVLAAPAGTRTFEASPVLQPPPQPPVPRPLSTPPAPWQAAGSYRDDRGTKREGFPGGAQGQRTGSQRPRMLRPQLANSTFAQWPHGALARPQHGLPYRPPQPPLHLPRARPPAPAPPAADSPPWAVSVTMPENSFQPGLLRDGATSTLSMPMSAPSNSLGVSAAGYTLSGPSGSFGGALPLTAFSGQTVTKPQLVDVHGSAGTGGDDGGSTTGNDTALTDASTAARPPTNGSSFGSFGSGHASVAPLAPDRQAPASRAIEQVGGEGRKALQPPPAARPAPPGHGQRGTHLQDICGARMQSMHDAPAPNGQHRQHSQVSTRARSGTPVCAPGSRAVQTNVLPYSHMQAAAPQNVVAGIADMLAKPMHQLQVPPRAPPMLRPKLRPSIGIQSAPISDEMFADPLAADRDGAQQPTFEAELSPGRAQDSLEVLAGNLPGSSADPGDSACIGAFSWERSGISGGSGGGGGGGGGSGSDGSNGANGAKSRRAFLTRRQSLP